MFGIQLTGQCVAKGQWRSGSVINYRQISSYKDPSPPGAPFFMASGKPHKSVAESPPRVTLTASIIVLHGLVHPLSACPKLNCLQKQRWMFPTHSSGVVNLPLFLPFPQLHNHFYLLSFFALVHAQHVSAMIEEGAAESCAPKPCISQCRGDSPASFSIPTS